MADRLVCDIYFYLYMRVFFGFYHKFEGSKRVRWLVRCYCCFICVNLIIWICNIMKHDYSFLPVLLTALEYLMYLLISLWKNNKYLLRYYKKTPLIDDVTINAYRPLRFYLVGYVMVLIMVKFVAYVRFLVVHWSFTIGTKIIAFLEVNSWCCNVVGRLPILFVFSLLYVRVRSMRKMLEGNEFQCRSQGKYHPQRYIQKYEAILNVLEKSDDAVKLQLFVATVFSSVFFTVETVYSLYSDSNIYIIGTMFDTIWFSIEVLVRFSPLLLTAILSDMVYLEVRKMLVITLKRRIDCKNERDRAEIQKLFQLLKDRPFQYSLWRLVPLNLRSVLSMVSFCITSIIAILQIKG